jgi:hypothetical protein
MLDMIGTLERNGYAYVAENRDVCYSVRKFEGYGKLSGKSLEDLRAGERVDVMAGKQDPLDFVLVEACARRRTRRSEVGIALGSGQARDGTSSARRWDRNCSADISTSTAVARICSFRITKTRLPSRKARTVPVRQLLDAQRLRPCR